MGRDLSGKSLLAFALAAATLHASSHAHAEPDANRPATATRYQVQSGLAFERFLGLDFRRLDVAFLLATPVRSMWSWELDLRLQPGRTASGLTSHRTEIGLGVLWTGWVRLGLGGHVAHTMVFRESKDKAVLRALFSGDIAGLGVGAHVSAEVEAFRSPGFALVIGARGVVEGFDGGAAYAGGGYAGAIWGTP